MLGKDNQFHTINLGLVHSSAAETITTLILNRLRQDGEIEDTISPNFLLRNWPAFPEWSTRSVRDAFFASPQFPRLVSPEAIKATIARGVSEGLLAYVGKTPAGEYQPFVYRSHLGSADVEISDDTFILDSKTAEACQKHSASVEPATPANPYQQTEQAGQFVKETAGTASVTGAKSASKSAIKRISWKGEIPPQKWTNFYTKVLSRFAIGHRLRLTLQVEVSQEDGISEQKVEETKGALRELGLNEDISIENG